MSTRDPLSLADPAELPEALREPLLGVPFAAFIVVEAARLDELPEAAVLGWLGVRESAFARVEERFRDIVSEELAKEGSSFDDLHEDLLGRALSLWARPVEPLDRDVEAWIAFQRHALLADDPGAMAQKSGLTPGDEVRLARLWRSRLALPEVAARAEAAMSGPLSPLPKLSLAPFAFPPSMEST